MELKKIFKFTTIFLVIFYSSKLSVAYSNQKSTVEPKASSLSYEYKLTGATEKDWTTFNINNFSLDISNKGDTYIYVKVTDLNTGNSKITREEISIQNPKTLPKVEFKYEYKLTGATEKDWTTFDINNFSLDISNEGDTYIYVRATNLKSGISNIIRENISIKQERETIEIPQNPENLQYEYMLKGATNINWTEFNLDTFYKDISNKGRTNVYVRLTDRISGEMKLFKEEVNIKNPQIPPKPPDSFDSSIKYEYMLRGATTQNWTEFNKDTFTKRILNKGTTSVYIRLTDKSNGEMKLFKEEVNINNPQIPPKPPSSIEGRIVYEYMLRGATTQNWMEFDKDSFTKRILNKGRTNVYVRLTDKSNGEMKLFKEEVNINNPQTPPINTIEHYYKLEGSTKKDWTKVRISDRITISNKGLTYISLKSCDKNTRACSAISKHPIGINKTGLYYKLNDNDWIEHNTSDKIRIEKEGINNITFRYQDIFDNFSSEKSETIKIDLTSPYMSANITYNDDNSRAKINIIASDDLSGIKYITSLDNEKIMSNIHEFEVSDNGVYLVSLIDVAGNISFESIEVNGLTDSSPSSGVKEIKYKLEGATIQDWTVYNGVFNLSKEGTTIVTAKAYDKAGNISDEIKLEVKIDKTKPIINQITIRPLN